MAKSHATFVCQSCGAVYNRWKGKCEACGGWNTVVEESGAGPLAGPAATRPSRAKGRVFTLEGLAGETHDAPRTAGRPGPGGSRPRGGARPDVRGPAARGNVIAVARREACLCVTWCTPDLALER